MCALLFSDSLKQCIIRRRWVGDDWATARFENLLKPVCAGKTKGTKPLVMRLTSLILALFALLGQLFLSESSRLLSILLQLLKGMTSKSKSYPKTSACLSVLSDVDLTGLQLHTAVRYHEQRDRLYVFRVLVMR